MNGEMEPKHADWLTEIAAGELAGESLLSELATRFGSAEEAERAAVEVEIARRVHRLMLVLRAREVEVPEHFESRLLERVRADQTLLEMLELYVGGFGSALVELINALFSFLPLEARPETT